MPARPLAAKAPAKRAPNLKHDRATLVPRICARLAGGEPLAVICRDIGVPVRTVDFWRGQDASIAACFDAARDEGFDAIAHRCRATARGKGDSTADVQRDKLIIETDLKLLAKWDPRRYGEKVTLAGDAENPLALAVTDARAKLAKRLGKHPDEL